MNNRQPCRSMRGAAISRNGGDWLEAGADWGTPDMA